MFGWLKNLFVKEPARGAPPSAGAPLVRLSVMDVVDRFLKENPQRTPLATLALIRAGATRLADDDEVRQACEKIAGHGYQYPLSPTVQRELPPLQLLEFLRWQESTGVDKQDYVNEHAVRKLLQRFRESR